MSFKESMHLSTKNGKIAGGKTPCLGNDMENAVNDFQKKVLGYKDPDGEISAKEKMWKGLLGMI